LPGISAVKVGDSDTLISTQGHDSVEDAHAAYDFYSDYFTVKYTQELIPKLTITGSCSLFLKQTVENSFLRQRYGIEDVVINT